MFENNSKFPRFIIIMLIALSILMILGAFFGETFVSILYFVCLIILVVFSLLDKKYGMTFTNHKTVYFLIDLINLIATGSYLIYEFENISTALKVTFIFLLCLIFSLILLDLFVLYDKYSIKKECMFINITQIILNICILICFYFNLDFWFGLIVIVIEILNIIIRVVVTCKQKNLKPNVEKTIVNDDFKIEEIINQNIIEGDIE